MGGPGLKIYFLKPKNLFSQPIWQILSNYSQFQSLLKPIFRFCNIFDSWKVAKTYLETSAIFKHFLRLSCQGFTDFDHFLSILSHSWTLFVCFCSNYSMFHIFMMMNLISDRSSLFAKFLEVSGRSGPKPSLGQHNWTKAKGQRPFFSLSKA